jgi:hypothetical protein
VYLCSDPRRLFLNAAAISCYDFRRCMNCRWHVLQQQIYSDSHDSRLFFYPAITHCIVSKSRKASSVALTCTSSACSNWYEVWVVLWFLLFPEDLCWFCCDSWCWSELRIATESVRSDVVCFGKKAYATYCVRLLLVPTSAIWDTLRARLLRTLTMAMTIPDRRQRGVCLRCAKMWPRSLQLLHWVSLSWALHASIFTSVTISSVCRTVEITYSFLVQRGRWRRRVWPSSWSGAVGGYPLLHLWRHILSSGGLQRISSAEILPGKSIITALITLSDSA